MNDHFDSQDRDQNDASGTSIPAKRTTNTVSKVNCDHETFQTSLTSTSSSNPSSTVLASGKTTDEEFESPRTSIESKESTSTAELTEEDPHDIEVKEVPELPLVTNKKGSSEDKHEKKKDNNKTLEGKNKIQSESPPQDLDQDDKENCAVVTKTEEDSDNVSDSDGNTVKTESKEKEDPKKIAIKSFSKSYSSSGKYVDYANTRFEQLSNGERSNLHLYNSNTISGPFPIKLQIVLKVIEHMGRQNVISWLPHGRAFIINRPREFENDIMNRFFKQTKLSSFKRQLNLYDFKRITHGADSGSYYHELFLRGKPVLAMKMMRRKIKGNDRIATENIHDEPNFYAMPVLGPINPSIPQQYNNNIHNAFRGRQHLNADHQSRFHPYNGMEGRGVGGLPIPPIRSSGSALNDYNDSFRYPIDSMQRNVDISSLRRHGQMVNQAQRQQQQMSQMMSMFQNQQHSQYSSDPRDHLLAQQFDLAPSSATAGLGNFNKRLANEIGPYNSDGNELLGLDRPNAAITRSHSGLSSMAPSSTFTGSSDAFQETSVSSMSQVSMLAQHQRQIMLEQQLLQNMSYNNNSFMNNNLPPSHAGPNINAYNAGEGFGGNANAAAMLASLGSAGNMELDPFRKNCLG